MMTANLVVPTVFGQWPPFPPGALSWIRDLDKGQCADLERTWEVKGGAPMSEITQFGLSTIGSGDIDTGYFEAPGWDAGEINGISCIGFEMPGFILTPEDVIPGSPSEFHFTYDCQGDEIPCNYDFSETTIDTMRQYDGMSAWWYSPNQWSDYKYYLKFTWILDPMLSQPCMSVPPPWYGKDDFYFANSIWEKLPDSSTVLSGDAPLNILASFAANPDSVIVNLHLSTTPDSLIPIVMHLFDKDSCIWHGTYENARKLGLKSYNDVYATMSYPISAWDMVHVALPQILTQVDTTFTDTVFIRSDQMKVAKDLKVSLRFSKDGDTSQSIRAVNLVDTLGLGYKYKSRWIANSQCNNTEVKADTFYRQFPRNASSYLGWDKHADSCRVTFLRDSLYVIGGELTIQCKGSLKHVQDINNGFNVNTDTTSPTGLNILQSKFIRIDKDPTNALFADSLKDTIIYAIAWQEYAGSGDPYYHCHNPYNPHYNNYWDNRIHNGDTCHDSHTPCENLNSSATGLMQITKRWHESDFDSTIHIPHGYLPCKWDSLAWNWKIDLFNGRYIYFKENFYNINHPATNPQKNWDSLYTPPTDYTPDHPNKEDLAVYGYHWGLKSMALISDTLKWNANVKFDPYVNDVRKYKDTKPWLH